MTVRERDIRDIAFWSVLGSFVAPAIAMGVTCFSLRRRNERLPPAAGWLILTQGALLAALFPRSGAWLLVLAGLCLVFPVLVLRMPGQRR